MLPFAVTVTAPPPLPAPPLTGAVRYASTSARSAVAANALRKNAGRVGAVCLDGSFVGHSDAVAGAASGRDRRQGLAVAGQVRQHGILLVLGP